jgi:thiol:disulfide interchange protein DsbD
MYLVIRKIFLLALLLISSSVFSEDFLPPEQAFKAVATWGVKSSVGQMNSDANIEITVAPAAGYYIYRESLKLYVVNQSGNAKESLAINFPKGKIKFDENFGKKLEVYPNPFQITAAYKQADLANLILEIELQGCADKGICYPPMKMQFKFATANQLIDGGLIDEFTTNQLSGNSPARLSDLWGARDDAGLLASLLKTISPAILIGAFFVLGLAMALTPCVLPMLPIMSSVVFGSKTEQHKNISRMRSSILALAYVLGMALMYSVAGMLTAALGSNIQVWLQSSWVLVAFSLLLLVLSASLFGFYELRLPHAWHNKIDQIAGKQRGGSVIGAFLLGAISTLIASPCVTAPLAGVLAFIAQTGSIPLGGLLLFVMALGMGLPLLLFAVGAKRLLPRAGVWMTWVQRIFGILLIALAAWVITPVFTKNQDAAASTHQLASGLVFQRVNNLKELNALVALANEKQKPVLVDFYADWCITCKEMELLTFNNPKVSKVLESYQLIQIDVTNNTLEHQQILKQYGLFGPPAILLIGLDGQEQTSRRVIGFMRADRFLERLH